MNSPDAFCLMQYRCDECGFIEHLWNSRDGITPFMVSSPCCDKKTSTHINFRNDTPGFELPNTVSRVFVNMTLEKAKELSQKYWDSYGEEMMANHEHLREIGKEALMESKVQNLYAAFGEGTSPCVLSRREYLDTPMLTAEDPMTIEIKCPPDMPEVSFISEKIQRPYGKAHRRRKFN